MHGFVFTGKAKTVWGILKALAELEREMPHVMALLDCQAIKFYGSGQE